MVPQAIERAESLDELNPVKEFIPSTGFDYDALNEES